MAHVVLSVRGEAAEGMARGETARRGRRTGAEGSAGPTTVPTLPNRPEADHMTRKAAPAPTTTRDYFRATGAELRAWAADGDEAASAESARRKAKREAKRAA